MDVGELRIERFTLGPLETNCYLVWCGKSKEGIVIDAGDDPAPVLRAAQERGVRIVRIVSTHGHFDHIAGVAALRAATGAPFAIGEEDRELALDPGPDAAYVLGREVPPVAPDAFLSDGEEIRVGAVSLRAIATPGHTPGGFCFHADGVLFTGDTLFAGSVGRTDLPGGNWEQLLHSIRTRILPLPEDTEILPGHGPFSRLSEERRSNPWMQGTPG